MVEKISRVLIGVEDNCWIGTKVKSNLRGQKPQISASMDPTALLELLSKVIYRYVSLSIYKDNKTRTTK